MIGSLEITRTSHLKKIDCVNNASAINIKIQTANIKEKNQLCFAFNFRKPDPFLMKLNK